MTNDDALGSTLWLVAGGAAGYAAGRLLVAPRFPSHVMPTPGTRESAASSRARALPVPMPRALASGPHAGPAVSSYPSTYGPSGDMRPVDPYAGSSADSYPATYGPSGDMRPIDPYPDPAPSAASVATTSAPFVIATAASTTTTTRPASSSPTRASTAIEGPITMPSQVDSTLNASESPSANGATTQTTQLVDAHQTVSSKPKPKPSASFATSARVRRFDSVFERYRGSLPIEYVRALVERESNGQPSVRAGSSIGLMQIVPVVLDDYNKRHGSVYLSEHLTEPATNVAIGCELLRLIIESYRKNHPKLRTLQEDWNNPRFVALLTLGWNAGFSEAGGVGRVARYLEGLGAFETDIDQVSAYANVAGASSHLSNPAKIAWCKSVVALYQRECAITRARIVS